MLFGLFLVHILSAGTDRQAIKCRRVPGFKEKLGANLIKVLLSVSFTS